MRGACQQFTADDEGGGAEKGNCQPLHRSSSPHALGYDPKTLTIEAFFPMRSRASFTGTVRDVSLQVDVEVVVSQAPPARPGLDR